VHSIRDACSFRGRRRVCSGTSASAGCGRGGSGRCRGIADASCRRVGDRGISLADAICGCVGSSDFRGGRSCRCGRGGNRGSSLTDVSCGHSSIKCGRCLTGVSCQRGGGRGSGLVVARCRRGSIRRGSLADAACGRGGGRRGSLADANYRRGSSRDSSFADASCGHGRDRRSVLPSRAGRASRGSCRHRCCGSAVASASCEIGSIRHASRLAGAGCGRIRVVLSGRSICGLRGVRVSHRRSGASAIAGRWPGCSGRGSSLADAICRLSDSG
jgi:hypothetical protein